MSVSLRQITVENFNDCIKLKVSDDQEDFVAANVLSIAQSKVAAHLIPLAVYNDEEIVGFTLHGLDPESKKYYIVRLMIDAKFQGKGFGKAATLELIKKMGENTDCNEVRLYFADGNTAAENLYSNIGFERTGKIDGDNEIEMRLDLQAEAQS